MNRTEPTLKVCLRDVECSMCGGPVLIVDGPDDTNGLCACGDEFRAVDVVDLIDALGLEAP